MRERYRRRGIGSALVREMLTWARQAGVPLIWVLADNPDAETFYESAGFRHGEEHEQGVLMLIEIAAGRTGR